MTTTLKSAAEEFLAQKRIAVAGVSRDTKQQANLIYRRLRDSGHEVFAVNPNADEVEGDRAYHDLTSVPGPIGGVVIGTGPAHAEGTVRECVDLGIDRVWMHRGPGAGSVSAEAAAYGREHGVTVIDGGCPCMFGRTADTGHKVMHLLGMGHMPKQV